MSAVNSDKMDWTETYYALEALTSENHLHYSQVQITKDLLTLVHSASYGFDHSAEVWPRVREAIDEAFKPPREKLRDKIAEVSALAHHAGDPHRMQKLFQAALISIDEPEGPY